MLLKAVFDSTVLVSAFLKPSGVCGELLRRCHEGAFSLVLTDEILDQVANVLLRPRIRKVYAYSDEAVELFTDRLQVVAVMVKRVPLLRGAVARDPTDDFVIACAVKARADYVVTRDRDMLDLPDQRHKTIAMISPEDFAGVLRRV